MVPPSNYNKTMSANNSLQIIPTYFGETRHQFDVIIYTNDNGEKTEYFILKQFEDYIGIKFGRKTVKRNCPKRIRWGDIRGTKGCIKDTPLSGYYDQPDAILVPEPNLYKLLVRSSHPGTDPFVDWVCNVLKEIRHQGFFTMPGVNIPPQVPQIQYVEKSHEQVMEEFQTLTCGCEYRRGAGTLYEQCSCANKDLRIKKRRENVAQGELLKGGVPQSSGKKGGLRLWEKIRAMEEDKNRFYRDLTEANYRIAELELRWMNFNLNDEE